MKKTIFLFFTLVLLSSCFSARKANGCGCPGSSELHAKQNCIDA